MMDEEASVARAAIIGVTNFATFAVNISDARMAQMRAQVSKLEEMDPDLCEATRRLLDAFAAWREQTIALYPEMDAVVNAKKREDGAG